MQVRTLARAVIELPEDFRDLLFALHDAGAAFVVLGGHAVAFHGHPRATKDLDVLVRADRSNARLVYRALAAFGAPLSAFEVGEADEAVAGGESFELEGRAIPVIGRAALLKNKRAAGREQDLADVKALERIK